MKPKNISCKYNLLLMAKLIFVMIMMVSLITCSKESKEPTYTESIIKVDSLRVEYFQTVESRELFTIHLYGTISSNGCSSYSHYKTYWQNQDFIIETWKRTEVDAMICTTLMVYLDEIIIFYRDSFPENFNIKVKQPDGSYLEKQMI